MSLWYYTRLVCLKGLHYGEQQLSTSLTEKPCAVLVHFQQIGRKVSNLLALLHIRSLSNCTQLLCHDRCWTQMAKQLPTLASLVIGNSYLNKFKSITDDLHRLLNSYLTAGCSISWIIIAATMKNRWSKYMERFIITAAQHISFYFLKVPTFFWFRRSLLIKNERTNADIVISMSKNILILCIYSSPQPPPKK